MSTDIIQNQIEASVAHDTSIKFKTNERVSFKLDNINILKKSIQNLFKDDSKSKLNNVVTLSELTTLLNTSNLNLVDAVVDLDINTSANSIIINKPDAPYLGYNSITVRTKPLEIKTIKKLTPEDLTATVEGLVLTKTDNSYSGIERVEIQDIALASGLEYTVTEQDLAADVPISFDFKNFTNFDDNIKEAYANKVFGAKDLTVHIPLIDYQTFTVDGGNIGMVLTPADIPGNLDGSGVAEGKLGFKNVKLKAILNSNITKQKIVEVLSTSTTACTWTAGTTTNSGIGYPGVEVAPIVPASIPIRNFIESSNTNVVFEWNSLNADTRLNNFISNNEAIGVSNITIKHPTTITLDDTNLFSSELVEQVIPGPTSTNHVLTMDFLANSSGYISYKLPSNSSIQSTTIGGINLVKSATVLLPAAVALNDVDFTAYSAQLALNSSLTFSTFLLNTYPCLEAKPIISKLVLKNIPKFNAALRLGPTQNSTYKSLGYTNDPTKKSYNPFLNLEIQFKKLGSVKWLSVIEAPNNSILNNIILKSSETVQLPPSLKADEFTVNKAGYVGISPYNEDSTATMAAATYFKIKQPATYKIHYSLDLKNWVEITEDSNLIRSLADTYYTYIYACAQPIISDNTLSKRVIFFKCQEAE